MIFIGLLVCAAVVVNTAPVQNYLTQKTAGYLSKKLKTVVSVRNLRIHLFDKADLEGLFVADQTGDTLLYAGDARIRISDWFFGGKEKTIHYIGLKDTKIYFHRFKNKDEWNYTFIEKAFASKSSSHSQKSTLNFSLRKVSLEDVRFFSKDEWTGTNYEASVESLTLVPATIDFPKKEINLRLLTADHLLFGITEYTGGRPSEPHTQQPDLIDKTPFNKGNWKISLKQLVLANSRFYLNHPEEAAPKGQFDASHLNITGILTDIKNIKINADTLTAQIADLAAEERCGLHIQKLKADVRVSPVLSECKNLLIQTDNSTLSGYYAMHYVRFPDFTDYIKKVKMVGHFRNSEVGIQDIVYFAPSLKRFAGLSVQISGAASGTVARLSAQNLLLNDGFSTLSGSLVMDGLPDINETYIDFRNVHLHTSGAAALFYAPELKQQQAVRLAALTSVNFSGNYTGFIRDFVAYGQINTNLGNLKADLNMKLPEGQKPQYSGTLSATNFMSGVLLSEQAIGTTSFNLKLNGAGFNPKTLVAKLNGTVSDMMFHHYNYRNISVNGSIEKQLFKGLLEINDPNAAFNFDGEIDFSKEQPLYHFHATIDNLNFKNLQLTTDSVRLAGGLQINMTGNQVNNLTGNAVLTNINLFRNGKRLNVDTLSLSSQILPQGFHQIDLRTNNATAQLKGQFYPSDLLNVLQMYFSYYLPEYFAPPKKIGQSRYFQFQINTGDISDLLSLIRPNLHLMGTSDISGMMNLAQQTLNLQGTITNIAFGKINSQQVSFDGQGNLSGLKLHVNAKNVTTKEDSILSELNIVAGLARDTARFQIETTSPGTIQKASLNGLAFADQDSLYMKLTPSQFNFDNEVWKIPSGNKIVFARRFISIQNLMLQSGNQKIEINPKGEDQSGNNALVRLTDIDLSPLNSFINLSGNKMAGRLNGTIHAYSLLDSSSLAFDLQADHVALQSDTIGTVYLNGSYSFPEKELTLTKNSGIHNEAADLSVLGTLKLQHKDSLFIDGKAVLNHAKIAWIAPFLTGVVHNVSGVANGTVSFTGTNGHLQSNGLITFLGLNFSPDLTGVHYRIPQGSISVSNTEFQLDSMLVYDTTGNTGILSGRVSHQGFGNFNFNIRMVSNQIKVLNQTKSGNGYFYGNVDAKTNTTIRGTWGNLTMHVIATPLRNSNLFITVESSSDLGNYKYIRFRKKGENDLMQQENGNKFNFILDAVVNPNLETTLILDPQTQEQIWAKGNGNIILNIPSDGEMKMNGNYVITEGKYDFSFRKLQVLNYKRQFTIDDNSNIKWDGNPFDADLDVTAHTTVKARLYDLVSDELDLLSNPEIQDAQVKQDVDIIMNLKGSLSKPEISFKMQLAEGRSIGTYAYQKLQRINSDEKQTLIQVSSLLLLGQFVPPEGINTLAISSGTINNMSELVSSVASSQLTNFANKLLGMQDLSVGVQYTNYSMSEANQLNALNYFNRNEAQLNLKKNFLNDRLVVEVGGEYNWGQAGTGSNYAANLAGDFTIQYLLTQDGRVRFSIFRTSDYDPLYSLKTIGRQGINLSYRKSFNNLKDFFSSKNKDAHIEKLELKSNDSNHRAIPDPIRQKFLKVKTESDSVNVESTKASRKQKSKK